MGWGRPERGPHAGPPGSGKTLLAKVLTMVAEKRGIKILHFQAKDCSEEKIVIDALPDVIKRISSVLQFSATEFRISFDVLTDADCSASQDIQCLIDYANKKFKQEIAMWVESRLRLLQRLFITNDGKITLPLCLKEYDEIAKRLQLGILYAVRNKISMPIIIDDSLAYIANESYLRAFFAMARPYIRILNRYPVQEELLSHNPIILTPGGQAGYYRLAHPSKYTIIFDHMMWRIDRKVIEKMAYSS